MKFKDILEKEVPEEILGMIKEEKKEEFEVRDDYYFYTDCGVINTSSWENDTIDKYRFKHCYASKTKKECEFKKEKAEVIHELEQYAKEHNEEIEWKNDRQGRWYIKFLGSGEICFDFDSYKRTNDIYFTSEELAKQAVAKVGEDRVKKYLFGVE